MHWLYLAVTTLSPVYVLAGGNLGDVVRQFKEALEMLLQVKEVKLISTSSIYSSKSWGFQHENDFLNQAWHLDTSLSPMDLLKVLLDIEQSMGRRRSHGSYEARNIDLDILFYDNLIINEPGLTIPHPLVHKRNFALIPLQEIAATLIHPVNGLTVKQMIERSEDKSTVEVCSGTTT